MKKEEKKETNKMIKNNQKKCSECLNWEEELKKMQKIFLAKEVNLINKHQEEVINLLKFKNQELITALLPTLDNLETALQFKVVHPQTKNFLKGVEISLKKMQATLTSFGLNTINLKIGDTYDSSLAETVDSEWDANKPKNSILKIRRTGYKLDERVIRPSQVVINIKKNNKKKEK